jgi:hypothetical protein
MCLPGGGGRRRILLVLDRRVVLLCSTFPEEKMADGNHREQVVVPLIMTPEQDP